MNIFTIGFSQKSAEQFFKLLTENRVKKLIDIRLNNKSQLAGFANAKHLPYFLKLHNITRNTSSSILSEVEFIGTNNKSQHQIFHQNISISINP